MGIIRNLAMAALAIVSGLAGAASATEVRDGDMPTIGPRSQAEAYASTGVPWGKQTLSFVGTGNSNGQPLIIGLIETSVVKTCNDGSMVLQMQITGFNPYQNGKAPSIDEYIIDGYQYTRTWISAEFKANEASYHRVDRLGNILHFYFETVGHSGPFIVPNGGSKQNSLTYIRTNTPFLTATGTMTLRGTWGTFVPGETEDQHQYEIEDAWTAKVSGLLAPAGGQLFFKTEPPCYTLDPKHQPFQPVLR